MKSCLTAGKGLRAPSLPKGLNTRAHARRISSVLFGRAACSVNGVWMVADPTDSGQGTAWEISTLSVVIAYRS